MPSGLTDWQPYRRAGQSALGERRRHARRSARRRVLDEITLGLAGVDGVLREVVDGDLDTFFERRRKPEANRMAAFPARDREAFDAHWRRGLVRRLRSTKRTIVYEGEVAGNVGAGSRRGSVWGGTGSDGSSGARALRHVRFGSSPARSPSDRCTRGSRRGTSPRSACARSAGSSASARTRTTSKSCSSSSRWPLARASPGRGHFVSCWHQAAKLPSSRDCGRCRTMAGESRRESRPRISRDS